MYNWRIHLKLRRGACTVLAAPVRPAVVRLSASLTPALAIGKYVVVGQVSLASMTCILYNDHFTIVGLINGEGKLLL